MSMQPFQGSQMVVIEKRKEDGSLDFSGEQPPAWYCPMCDGVGKSAFTFDKVYEFYFQDNPDGVGSWEALKAWLDSKGWKIRAKTW
jgi:hypothetical protein